MGLKGKKTIAIEIKSNGDAFHKLFRHTPHHVSNLSPNTIQGCALQEGEWGSTTSVVVWNYFLDGKHQVGKNIVHMDEEKRAITFELIEGDLKELYKSLIYHVHVEEKDGGSSSVTWTVEYEKFYEEIPDPDTVLELITNLTKDIESGHLNE